MSRSTYGLAQGAGTLSATLDDQPLSVQFDGPWGSGEWRAEMDLTPGAHTLQVSAVDLSGLEFGAATSTFACATNAGDTISDPRFYADGNAEERVWFNSQGQWSRFQMPTWDAFNRLVGFTDLDAQYNGYNWSVVYDGLGRRIQTTSTLETNCVAITSQPTTITSVFDPQVEFLEVGVGVNGAFTMKTYGPDANGVYGGMQGVGGLEAITTYGHTAPTGVVQDYFGNVIGTIANGAVSWSPMRFSSYGPVPGYQQSTLGLSTPLAQSLGWRGKRVDETGYINLGARLYDPGAGRFMSADPLGHGASQDLYSFAGGDPVNRFDPDGRCPGNNINAPPLSSLNIPYTSPQQYQQMQSFLSPLPPFDINAYSPPPGFNLGQNTPAVPSNPGTISATLPPPYTYQDLLIGAPNLVGTPMGYQIAQGNALNYMTTPGTAIIGNAVAPILNSIFADTAAADSQMITVLGSGRNVAPYVGRTGFNTFTGAGIPQAEWDTQNALWLNTAIQRGDQIWLVTDPAVHQALMEAKNLQSAYLNLELPMLDQYSGVNAIPKYVTAPAAAAP